MSAILGASATDARQLGDPASGRWDSTSLCRSTGYGTLRHIFVLCVVGGPVAGDRYARYRGGCYVVEQLHPDRRPPGQGRGRHLHGTRPAGRVRHRHRQSPGQPRTSRVMNCESRVPNLVVDARPPWTWRTTPHERQQGKQPTPGCCWRELPWFGARPNITPGSTPQRGAQPPLTCIERLLPTPPPGKQLLGSGAALSMCAHGHVDRDLPLRPRHRGPHVGGRQGEHTHAGEVGLPRRSRRVRVQLTERVHREALTIPDHDLPRHRCAPRWW
jgi:hypothetical protein